MPIFKKVGKVDHSPQAELSRCYAFERDARAAITENEQELDRLSKAFKDTSALRIINTSLRNDLAAVEERIVVLEAKLRQDDHTTED